MCYCLCVSVTQRKTMVTVAMMSWQCRQSVAVKLKEEWESKCERLLQPLSGIIIGGLSTILRIISVWRSNLRKLS
jgi:hypothetical protein